jgi:putative protease
MELLAPAGNLEKLATAYRYGADAAYIGVHGFSLRTYADATNVADGDEDSEALAAELTRLKGDSKRLYAALNMFAHEADVRALPSALERLAQLPIDAVIIADIGLIDTVRRALPDVELHLSTQANCTNSAAARVYHRLGFSRVIPARELSLDEVKAIKDAVPELGVEVFVHGAMCMAYSGRCFMSNYLTGRGANQGDCAQSCRWNYHVEHFRLEEEKRPGEWIPVEADGRFLSVLSSRDLNLFDHIPALIEAGVDSVKIEGRMKSAYYVAAVTRSYRAAIDAAPAQPDGAHRAELFRIAHREYTTGFLMGDRAVHDPASSPTLPEYRLMAIVGERVPAVGPDVWRVHVKNTVTRDMDLEFLPPDPQAPAFISSVVSSGAVELLSESGDPVDRITNATHGLIRTDVAVSPGMIVRAVR